MKYILIKVIAGALLLLFFPTTVFAYSTSDIISAVNSTRQNNHLSKLVVNSQLNQAAALKLADIQKYQYWSHDNPQSGATWLSFIKAAGYKYSAGENLARGYGSSQDVMAAWLNSAGHRKNLLSSFFNSCGVAVGTVNYSNGPETVVVLVFGKSPQITSSPSATNLKSNLLSWLNRIFSKPVLAYHPTNN